MLFTLTEWGEEEEGGSTEKGSAADPKLSALTWGAVQTEKDIKKKIDGDDKTARDASNSVTQKKKKKRRLTGDAESSTAKGTSLAKKAEKLSAKLGHSLAVSTAYKLDKFVNSPSATKTLLDPDDMEGPRQSSGQVLDKLVKTAKNVSEAGRELGRSVSSSMIEGKRGNLLTLGEKFSSQEAFLRFIGLPAKGKRGKKRLREGEEEMTDELAKNENAPIDIVKDEETPPIPPPRKKKREGGVDISKLREVLAKDASKAVDSKVQIKLKKTLAEEAKIKLSASRFRYLNEQLYTQPGNASAKLFRSDPTLFSSYHQGYQHQAQQWPLDPLNTIISDCLRLGDDAVIADFGCGEARLARSVENKVHSFDLVAANDRVTACDMANIPLAASSVDVAVFCLSLMGTNIRDFLYEATRVLKVGGTLKIAELESRFQGESCSVDSFIDCVQKFGFKNSWKDLKKDFFYFLDFKKVQEVKKKKGKLPEVELKPCLYKKR